MLTLLQGLPVPSLHDAAEAVGFVALAIKSVLDHRKGTRRDTVGVGTLSRIEKSVTEVRDEVRDLSAHVIGPDGKNGLRGRVEALEQSREREREAEIERLRHAPYDRRATT